MPKYTHDVFISYRHDSPNHKSSALLARLICESLRKKPYCYDVYLDTDDLKGGKYSPQLFKAIAESRCFLCVLPSDGLNDCCDKEDWIHKEVSYAIDKKKKVIPVLMEGFDISSINSIPLPNDVSSFFDNEYVCEVNAENYNSKLDKIVRLINLKPKKSVIKKKYIAIVGCTTLVALLFFLMIMYNKDIKNELKDDSNASSFVVNNDVSVQSESTYTKTLEQHLDTKAKISESLYNDYDSDGNYEMFSLVYSPNDCTQSLWFTNQKGCSRIKVFDRQIIGQNAHIELLSDGNTSLLNLFENASANWGGAIGDPVNNNYIFGVNNNEPIETPGVLKLTLKQRKEFNALIIGKGIGFIQNQNVYYFYTDKGRLKEYGFIPCDESFVRSFDNGNKIIQDILDKDKNISITGYYRSERIISLNVKEKTMIYPSMKEEMAELCYSYYISGNTLLPLEIGTAIKGDYYCYNKDNAVFPKV